MKSINNLLHVLLFCIGLLSLNVQAGVEITYIHNDALGSPVAGTDEQGNVKWRSHYQPYGEELLGERQLFGVRAGYTGHREDLETGLTYMGARYYSPTIGRFMGVDPAGVSESNLHSFNRYAYANNNPYNFIDPDGEVAVNFVLGVFGGVVGAISGGLSASATGGDFTDIAASAAIGFVFGAASGATFGAVPAAPAGIALSGFARSASTGALAAAAGETAGQLVTGSEISELDGGKIGASAFVGATSGMGGFVTQQMGAGARAGIAAGAAIEFMASPAVARAGADETNARE